MYDEIEESVIAKSTGEQEEKDIAQQDTALYSVLRSKKKMTKDEAGYRVKEKEEEIRDNSKEVCVKCKFNLHDKKNAIL
jgi:hypothetical protein